MGRPIRIEEVVIISIFVECILYGFFAALFLASAVIIVKQRTRTAAGRLNLRMLLVAIAMFILATLVRVHQHPEDRLQLAKPARVQVLILNQHVGSDLRRVLTAFIYIPDNITPEQYLTQVNNVIYCVKNTAYCLQTLVGDGFMVYRLYVVWNADKRVVIPIGICFIASIAAGVGTLQGFARAPPDAQIFMNGLHYWITSFFSLTLFINFSSTLLIAGRIWWVRRLAGVNSGSQNITRATIIIVESGAIYSFCLIILLSLYLTQSYAQYILVDAVTQVIGLVYSMVIIRVAMGIASNARSDEAKEGSRLIFAAKCAAAAAIRVGDAHCDHMQPIHITTTVDMEPAMQAAEKDNKE